MEEVELEIEIEVEKEEKVVEEEGPLNQIMYIQMMIRN